MLARGFILKTFWSLFFFAVSLCSCVNIAIGQAPLPSNSSGTTSSESVPQEQAEREQPNVIVILTDDQGWGDLSFNGNTNLRTPNIDRIAQTGVRFDRFYVCPVCAPTRAEFLTGRYHLRGGVLGVSRGEERLDPDERTIAHYFKAAGYKTAAFGKWHNGMQYPYHPLARGFDEFYGYCSGHWGDYFSPQLEHNGKLVQGKGYLVDDFTNHALDFIEENKKDPFFLYLPMPTPHAPMQVPDQYWQRMENRNLAKTSREGDQEDEDFTRAALAMVECIDFNVGRILAKLEQTQLRNDTIILFFCDNGPNSYRWNGGMKGKKGSTDEGGVRSPLFMSWPRNIKPGRLVTQITGAIDLLPTLTEFCDVPLVKSNPSQSNPLDGVSLKPLVMGTSGALPDRAIFSHWNKKVSVRTQRFRLDHRRRLFDMNLDPGQMEDVSKKFPDVHFELDLLAKKWLSDMSIETGGSWEDERPFSIGHPDFHLTQLPARDAIARGEIERSGKAPNCSYYTNWKSKNDSITWTVDVLEKGNFLVDMYYACPQESLGSQVELSLGGNRISKTIDVANDPPAVGAEHDRVVRTTQSFVKDFKPLRLGKMALPKGKGELELRARKIMGESGLEFRLLMLRRVR